jgi:putative transposase
MKVEFVDSQRVTHGVQPVLQALSGTPAEIAPSTYYAHKKRPASARSVRDAGLTRVIEQVHEDNYGVYGVRKMWHELNRKGHEVARCTVERLMRTAGLRGVLRDKSPRTTKPAPETGRPTDLVERDFTATRPNALWVADITYIRTSQGWVYAAFVLDVFSRMIVGWQVATSLYTDLALDGLQPDVGHEVLWVLRDCLSGEVLLARSLLSATSADFSSWRWRAIASFSVLTRSRRYCSAASAKCQ